jgi:class 3 adenylate cyclase
MTAFTGSPNFAVSFSFFKTSVQAFEFTFGDLMSIGEREAAVETVRDLLDKLRRLAAILAADVVGYSRMMNEDEEGTFAALQRCHSELIDPAIARHHGRTFKLVGDGLLAEFSSVVEAVACAAEFQREMAARNADVAS